MDCPKCSAPNAGDALECANCGVIFAKTQSRPSPPRSMPPAAPVPVERSSPALIVTIAAVFLAFGGMWVVHRRSERAAHPVKAMDLDQLNHDYVTRQKAAREQAIPEARRISYAQRAQRHMLPLGITKAQIVSDIQHCDAFATDGNDVTRSVDPALGDITHYDNGILVAFTYKTFDHGAERPESGAASATFVRIGDRYVRRTVILRSAANLTTVCTCRDCPMITSNGYAVE